MASYKVIMSFDAFDLQEQFKLYGRGDSFSLRALAEILERESDLAGGEPVELDIVGLCGVYSELDIDYALEYYTGQDMYEDMDGDLDEALYQLQAAGVVEIIARTSDWSVLVLN